MLFVIYFISVHLNPFNAFYFTNIFLIFNFINLIY